MIDGVRSTTKEVDMTTLLAIDPGKKTGWSEIQYDESTFNLVVTAELDVDEVFETLLNGIDDPEAHHPDVIVIEDFRITVGTGKLGSPDWSLRLIGAVEYLGFKYDIPVVKQFPSNAKAFSTNEKLRAVGMWHKGGAGHANDSLRHAMLYMVKHGWRDDRLLEADSE